MLFSTHELNIFETKKFVRPSLNALSMHCKHLALKKLVSCNFPQRKLMSILYVHFCTCNWISFSFFAHNRTTGPWKIGQKLGENTKTGDSKWCLTIMSIFLLSKSAQKSDNQSYLYWRSTYLKFMFSKKATKIDEIFTVDLT